MNKRLAYFLATLAIAAVALAPAKASAGWGWWVARELASLLARAGATVPTGTTAIVRMGTMAMAIGPIMGIVGTVTTVMVTAVTGHAMHIAAGTNWVAT